MSSVDVAVSGEELLDIANGSWNEKRQEYRGFQYLIAVNQAKKGIEKVRGGRKERKEEARHTVDVMFTHARNQSSDRLSKVAMEASQPMAAGFGDAGGELQAFASEVVGLLNGPLSAGFGVFDPAMIIGLIQAIISAIQACKKPPVPQPV